MNFSIAKTKLIATSSIILNSFILFFKRIRLKYIFLFFVIQIFVAIAVFLLFGLIPVKKEVERIYSAADSSSIATYNSFTDDEKTIYNDLIKTKRDEDYLISEIQLSKNDSIYLVLNINDSLARLMVKGVPLFE